MPGVRRAAIYEWCVKQNLDAGGIVSLRASFTPDPRTNWKIIRAANCGLLGYDYDAVK